jgi:hypothetical protein
MTFFHLYNRDWTDGTKIQIYTGEDYKFALNECGTDIRY